MRSLLRQLATLLKQRRIWAGIIGVIIVALNIFNVDHSLDTSTLTKLLADLGDSIAAIIMAGLALWSYFRPKE